MKSSEDIEKLITRLGNQWPADGSIVDRVMREIESAPAISILPKRRRILMKSLVAVAVSLAACVTLWLAIEGNHNSLYAQVIDAARKARTIHITGYEQPKGESEPTKLVECWYESGVGFRRDIYHGEHKDRQCETCLGNENNTWTLAKDQKNTVIRSRSRGITKETEQIFADIDRIARELQDNGQRYPDGDQKFDGQPCHAYLDRSNLSSKTGKRRELYYLDQKSRIFRVETQEQDENRWKTTQFCTIRYDEPLDAALFQPNFGKDIKIVDDDAKPVEPDRTAKASEPEGPILTYEIDPSSKAADTTIVDMDRLLKVVDVRLNGGTEKLAVVRKLDDRRIEVTLMRQDDADRQRVDRQLMRPGTLEFRILAENHIDKALIDRAQNEPTTNAKVVDSSGEPLAWWVPVRAGSERGFSSDVVQRTRKVDGREVMENLVVADPYNVTGAYLTQAKLQFDPTGNPMVNFTFNELGGKLFGMLTGDHLPNKSTGFVYSLGIIIDGELFFAPQIRSKISSQAQITGSFTEIEASDLAAVLNAGRLPVRLRQVQEIGVGGPDSSAIGVP